MDLNKIKSIKWKDVPTNAKIICVSIGLLIIVGISAYLYGCLRGSATNDGNDVPGVEQVKSNLSDAERSAGDAGATVDRGTKQLDRGERAIDDSINSVTGSQSSLNRVSERISDSQATNRSSRELIAEGQRILGDILERSQKGNATN